MKIKLEDMEYLSNKNTDLEVSYFENFKFVKIASFEKIIASIKNGFWKDQVIALRKGRAKEDDTWESLKFQLPAFTPSAIFKNKRRIEFLVKYNQLLMLDIDKVSENSDTVNYLRNIANSDQHTLASFVSPSGNGIKLFVRVNSKPKEHEEAVNQLICYYQELLAIGKSKFDKRCKDINRLCYVSYDDKAYYHADAKIFEVNKDLTYKTADNHTVSLDDITAVKPSILTGKSQFQKVVHLTLQKIPFEIGSRNDFIRLLAGNCNRWGTPFKNAFNDIMGSEYCYNQKEVADTIKSAYNKVEEYNKYPLKYSGEKAEAQMTINVSTEKFAALQVCDLAEISEDPKNNPFIPDSVFENLPDLIRDGTAVFDDNRQRDVFLTGVLGVLSGCFNNVSGIYDNRRVWCNLYVFITAPPASGKGVLLHAKQYGILLHEFLLNKNSDDLDSPKIVLFIPGNTSAGAMINHLKMNDGVGIFFESEADTLNNAIQSEWGNFSDLMRKAFHQEPFSLSRKGNNELTEIKRPKLSVVLSGTPEQVHSLTKSVKDGLFSRFLFYSYTSDYNWRDVSPVDNKEGHDEYFEKIAPFAFKAIQSYSSIPHTNFNLTVEQWKILNSTQSGKLEEIKTNYGDIAASLVLRMGLMWYKIAMVLSVVRNADNENGKEEIVCTDVDFQTAKKLIEVYSIHILSVFKSMPQISNYGDKSIISAFYNMLPSDNFQREDGISIGQKLNIRERKSDEYLKIFIDENKLIKPKYGWYKKVTAN